MVVSTPVVEPFTITSASTCCEMAAAGESFRNLLHSFLLIAFLQCYVRYYMTFPIACALILLLTESQDLWSTQTANSKTFQLQRKKKKKTYSIISWIIVRPKRTEPMCLYVQTHIAKPVSLESWLFNFRLQIAEARRICNYCVWSIKEYDKLKP